MKSIVICADGTWNDPTDEQPTNILQIARGVSSQGGGSHQVVFYDWGVGSYYDQVKGGAAGEGLEKNITDCYRFLVQNFEPGDQLYFFGFSRGAFTVRSLAGFIRNCGILKPEHDDKVEYAFNRIYKNRSSKQSPDAPGPVSFRKSYAYADRQSIHFVGVFDTVGSLGCPVSFWGLLGNDGHVFHDLEPSSIVKTARHAVAIDELRTDYEVCLWKNKPAVDLKQVWFPGCHCDIGGGYPDDHVLADNALLWMLREATAAGLHFDQFAFPTITSAATVKAKAHNEYKKLWKLRGKCEREPAVDALFHESFRQRHVTNPSAGFSDFLSSNQLSLQDVTFVS
jgi:uncharacterized protein (DUF2235 family)